MTEGSVEFRGVVLPDGVARTLSLADGRVSYGSTRTADEVVSGVWVLPGLVDAHCHVGLGEDGPQDEASQEQQGLQERDAGTLTIRDCGSPVDTRWIDGRPDLPQILRAGRHIAAPKRHTRGIGLEVEPADLVTAVEGEIAQGDGWVKLVGDWIDRDRGDLAPLWPRSALTAAISRAHELGARVTAHCFGEEALPDLLEAGIDCIEHGTGLTDDWVQLMADRQVALVPTLINIARFPQIADRGSRFPTYAEHIRALHRTSHQRVRAAHEAGVPIYAGTDAGSEVRHGLIAEEVMALHDAGLSRSDAVAAASWAARSWLNVGSGVEEGAPANFVVYDSDPVADLDVLRHPRMVVLRGRVYAPGGRG